MKIKNIFYLLSCAFLLTSCHLEAPETPAEELFLRNFIKRFGLIDPNQDWNLAEHTQVLVNVPNGAKKLVAYAEIFDDFYRVARYYDIEPGASVLPLDVPINATGLALDIDGIAYLADIGGSLDTSTATPVAKAPAEDDKIPAIWLDEESILGWVILAEDLGSTDDVDFNDVVFRLEYDQNAHYALGEIKGKDWNVIKQGAGGDFYFNGTTVVSRDGEEEVTPTGKTVVTVKALAAGGILPSWLHYRDKSDKDFIIAPSGKIANTTSLTNASNLEWHSWFGSSPGIMINTACGDMSGGNNHDGTTTDYVTSEAYNKTALPGAKVNIEVERDFSFSTYSQLKYSDGAPIISGDFTFDYHTINGFYITVNSHVIDPNNKAFDVGHVIGHNLNPGLPPQMFLVPDLCYYSTDEGETHGNAQSHFHWATERTQIDVAYIKFGDWVKTGNVSWYQYGRSDMVVTDDFLTAIYAD